MRDQIVFPADATKSLFDSTKEFSENALCRLGSGERSSAFEEKAFLVNMLSPLRIKEETLANGVTILSYGYCTRIGLVVRLNNLSTLGLNLLSSIFLNTRKEASGIVSGGESNEASSLSSIPQSLDVIAIAIESHHFTLPANYISNGPLFSRNTMHVLLSSNFVINLPDINSLAEEL